MSRTAHHGRSRRTGAGRAAGPVEPGPGAPLLAVSVRDLRYSARCRAEAERAGRRTRPQAVRRHVAIRCLPRWLGDSVAAAATLEERRARQRLRAQTRAVLRLVDGGRGGPLDPFRAEDCDIPPPRHRRGELWLA